jgi:phosphatidylglycerophosphatase A
MTATDIVPRKPQIALAIATSLGLGYLPAAPGTWGSLAGIVVYGATQQAVPRGSGSSYRIQAVIVALVLAIVGVWAAGVAASYSRKKDPQFVVIDEVSGQFLAYFVAQASPNWKYLLLGFILFRVFDIWKPFPARQAEFLPGGLGIMADDWIAGVYAAIGLLIARHFGL